MKTKLTFALLLALFVISGVTHRAQDADSGEIKLDAKEFTLDNGLRVVVVNRPGVPVVSTYVWYAAGACDAPVSGHACYSLVSAVRGTVSLSLPHRKCDLKACDAEKLVDALRDALECASSGHDRVSAPRNEEPLVIKA